MFDFKYYTPTKVVFGRNTEQQVADLIKEFGGKKVLTQREIAQKLNISRSYISRIEKKALEKLRKRYEKGQ